MSEKEFERYLKLLGGLLGINRQQREAIADELRDHFDERLHELQTEGLSHDDAVAQALEEFGDAAGMAQRFVDVAHNRTKKRMFRVTAFSIIGLAAGILLLLAMWPENARVPLTRTTIANVDEAQAVATSDNDTKEMSEADRKVFKVLDDKFQAEFLETPLTDVFDYLEHKSGVPIILEKRSLEMEGIDSNPIITKKLESMRLRSVLNLILGDVNLDWKVEDGTIVVASAAQIKEEMQSRVYDVSDLMKVGDATSQISWEALTSMIQRHTGGRENEWAEYGGLGNIVLAVEGVMVVSHNAKAHVDIVSFLSALRQARDRITKLGTAMVKPIAVHPASDEEVEINRKLSEKIASFEFVETPLGDILEFFSVREGIKNVLLDRKSLEDVGIAADTTISMCARNEQTFRMALGRMLREHSLVPVVQNDALLITTAERARELLVTRIYPMHDLLNADPEIARMEMEKFVNLITTTTGMPRQNWTDFGGTNVADGVASLKVLVISATADTHDDIDRLLDGIRRSQKSAAAHSKAKPEEKGAAATAVTQRVYFLNLGGETGKTLAEAKELGKAITELLAVEIGAEVNQVQITALSDRLVIRAPAAIHRRLDKMALNELSGLLNTDSVMFGRSIR